MVLRVPQPNLSTTTISQRTPKKFAPPQNEKGEGDEPVKEKDKSRVLVGYFGTWGSSHGLDTWFINWGYISIDLFHLHF